RPRGRRPARQDQGLRLRLHHVHPDPPAPRGGGPAGGGDVRGRAVVEGLRARRARHHDDDRLLAPLPPARRRRRGAQRARGAALTALWGVFAVAFALFAGFAENLIEAINILGSIFYGVMLGIFLVAFFLRRVGGS